MEFSKIKKLRKELGLSQKQLGALIGVNQAYMGAIERRIKNPTIPTAIRLSKVLNSTLDELFVEEQPHAN